MCEPITVGLIVGSAAIGAYSKYKEAQTEEAMLEAQAKAQEIQAGDARQRGAIEAGFQRMETSQEIADQQLAYVAAGVDSTTGTPMSVQASTRGLGEYEALARENDAIREAWGYETTARMTRFKKSQVMKQARTEIVGSFIGAGAQAYSMGTKLKVPAKAQLATTTGQ